LDWFGLVCFANKNKNVSCHTANSKPVKQEVSDTVILPPLVFPGYMHDNYRNDPWTNLRWQDKTWAVFNFKQGHAVSSFMTQNLTNLKWKTQPKQLLSFIHLSFALTE
jgi:hypothetical protein